MQHPHGEITKMLCFYTAWALAHQPVSVSAIVYASLQITITLQKLPICKIAQCNTLTAKSRRCFVFTLPRASIVNTKQLTACVMQLLEIHVVSGFSRNKSSMNVDWTFLSMCTTECWLNLSMNGNIFNILTCVQLTTFLWECGSLLIIFAQLNF